MCVFTVERRINCFVETGIASPYYDHFRSFFVALDANAPVKAASAPVEPVPVTRAVVPEDAQPHSTQFVGRSISLASIPQRVLRYQRTAQLEVWEIFRVLGAAA